MNTIKAWTITLRGSDQWSRLLRNHSKTEGCHTHNGKPWGYQTVDGDWLTLSPKVGRMTSRLEEDGGPTLSNLELVTERQSVRAADMKWLYGWAEHHPKEFARRSSLLGLTNWDLSFLHEDLLKEGFTRKEYKDFISRMETKASRGNSLKIEVSMIISWALQLGMVGVLLATCGIGAQLSIQRYGIFKQGENNLETRFDQEDQLFFRVEPEPGSHQAVEKSEQYELDPGNIEEVWPEPSTETLKNIAEGRMAPHGWRHN